MTNAFQKRLEEGIERHLSSRQCRYVDNSYAYYAHPCEENTREDKEWFARYPHIEPAAFMGITGAHLDALFAAPEYFGRGAGAALMREALARGVRSVDVNEQNPRARRFYEKHGFQTAGRRETDDCGKPYPLLRMDLAEDGGR